MNLELLKKVVELKVERGELEQQVESLLRQASVAGNAYIRTLQKQGGLAVDGIIGPKTMRYLMDRASQADIPNGLLSGFRGDIAWIHKQEGHRGRPYWPGGLSGVTLDPGCDLGYQNEKSFLTIYRDILEDQDIDLLLPALGLKGPIASSYLSKHIALTENINITRNMAQAIFPNILNTYWEKVIARWPSLISTETPAPPEVHTAMLSLGYNRGPGNRHLEPLTELIRKGDWKTLGYEIRGMQQDHRLSGIRRRRKEEGDLILDALSKELS